MAKQTSEKLSKITYLFDDAMTMIEESNFDGFKELIERELELVNWHNEEHDRATLLINIGACHHGSPVNLVRFARYLMKECAADVNACNVKGETALMMAAMTGKECIVKILLAEGNADVDAKDTTHGGTALMMAALNGHEACVRALLAAGNADVNAKDTTHGNTALMMAAGQGHEACVRALLAAGNADIDAKDTTD